MGHLKMPPEKALLLISERIDDIKNIKKDPDGLEYYDFIRWCSKTWSVIDEIYGSGDPHSEELRLIGLPGCACNANRETRILADLFQSRLQDYIDEIKSSPE
ncbi:MAG TPA: hypothetical protein PKM50_03700 [Methanoregula sp.]|nr:hypothetical protein [Methanoregula sp.]